MFGKNGNFEIIKNGIAIKKFEYNEEIRSLKREELGLKDDEIVITHIGRFVLQKNHNFLVEIMKELVKLNSKYKLLLVGNGELEQKIKEKIEKLNLKKNIKILGVRKDINSILQATDLFILPSFHEGLPVTLVEAQGAGLKCFISDSVTREIDLECGLTEFISLNKSAQEWAEIIDNNKEYKRKNTVEALRKHGYDMTQNAKELENLYIELYKNS